MAGEPFKFDKGEPGLPLSEYLALPRAPETWLLEGILPVSGKMLIFSPPKLGKSFLAIQLAQALIGAAPDWMGFPVRTTGKVFYLQVDTPPSTWSNRFNCLQAHGFRLNDQLILADEKTIGEYIYPVDVLQPSHINVLGKAIMRHEPIAVIIDTLRKVHSGDENSSTHMSQAISGLRRATFPAALILISHDRKPQPEADTGILSAHRGSTAVVAEMDTIIQLSRNRLKYVGRDMEEDSIKIVKQEFDDVLLWMPDPNEYGKFIERVMEDASLHPDGKLWVHTRARARALASMIPGKTEDGCMSALRRASSKRRAAVRLVKTSEALEIVASND
jgi:RecA-family ATPase